MGLAVNYDAIITTLLDSDNFEEYFEEKGMFPTDIDVPSYVCPFKFIERLNQTFRDKVENFYGDFWNKVISFDFVLNSKKEVMFVIDTDFEEEIVESELNNYTKLKF